MFYYGTHFWFALLVTVFFWTVVITLFAQAFRQNNINQRNRNHMRGQDYRTALDILNSRYAKGEISKSEYEQMKKDILAMD